MGPMRRYGILHPLVLSFFSRSLYRDVGRNWRGVGFLYLLLLLTLSWLPSVIQLHRDLKGFAATFAPALLEQVPALRIVDGKVSIEEDEPYSIRNPLTGDPLAIIDTTGRTTSSAESGVPVLLTRSQLIIRKSRSETRVYDLSAIKDFSIDRQRAERWVAAITSWFAIVFYPLALVVSLAYRILQALLYAAIGIGFAKLLKADLAYPALVRLAAVAVTPAIALDTLRHSMSQPIAYWWFICFTIAMGYLCFAVNANAGSEPESAPLPA